MKRQSIIREIALYLVVLATLSTACQKDYYNPDSDSNSEKKTITDIFGIDFVIPDGFDWSTLQTSSITVKIDDQYNGTKDYTIEVLADDPIITTQARLLKKVTIRGNKTLETTVTYPKANSYIYVRQTDPEGRKVVKLVDVSQTILSVDFSTTVLSETKNGLDTRNLELRTLTSSSEPQRVYPTPEDATTIDVTTENITLNAGKSYVLKSDYTGLLNFEWGTTGSNLYIEGTWTNTNPNFSSQNWNIIIQNGGEYKSNDGTLTISNSSKFIIAEGGIFNAEAKNITLSQTNDGSQIINNGIFKASELSQIREIYNYGEMVVSGKISTTDNNSLLINNGTLSVNEINLHGKLVNNYNIDISGTISATSGIIIENNNKFQTKNITISGSQGTIQNNCTFIVNKDASFGNQTINSLGLFKVKNLTLYDNPNYINLEANSIFDITKLDVQNPNAKLNGPANGKALARIKNAEFITWGTTKFTLSGNIDIEHSKNFPSADYYFIDANNNGISFFEEGMSELEIPADDCHGEGNTPTPTGGGETGGGETEDDPVGMGYTYAFEDGYPQLGDYDVNDLVLYLETSLIEASENIRSLTIKATLKATGATLGLGAAIQLTNIEASAIGSVTRRGDISLTGNTFTSSGNLETGQSKAVIPLFDEAHEVFGVAKSQMVNTITSSEYLTPKTVTLTITFNRDVTLSMANLDVFIINGGSKNNRKEVHLPHFSPTDKGQSETNGYLSEENLVWGVSFPGEFKYPLEYTNIIVAYPDFKDCATSGGTTNANWYESPVNGKVYQ